MDTWTDQGDTILSRPDWTDHTINYDRAAETGLVAVDFLLTRGHPEWAEDAYTYATIAARYALAIVGREYR